MLAGAAADVDGPHLGGAAAAGDRGSSGRALGIRLADQSMDSQQQQKQHRQQQQQKPWQKRVCFGDLPSVGPMPYPTSASAQQTPPVTPAAAAAPEVKQALDMRDNSSSSEGADSEGSDGAALWVVCDGCQKWRQLSGDTQVRRAISLYPPYTAQRLLL